MKTVLVTGSGGLIGSQAVRHYAALGFDVVGVENDMRASFFGPAASTRPVTEALKSAFDAFQCHELDIRDTAGVSQLVAQQARGLELVVHAAAQPSHDWAARDPQTDFGINANGTLNLLEAMRQYAPDVPFVFLSTNKVYGDHPNSLPLEEWGTRFELAPSHAYHSGIDTSMSLDRCTHSLFGVSKAAADLMVQEYGRYFDLPTVCFRGGCLTGPSHAGAPLHGFLAYLMKCTVTGEHYTVHGYGGKQVRDNIHAADVIGAIDTFRNRPSAGAVYNLGGGRKSNCSMLEAIAHCEQIAERQLHWTLSDQPRVGDHRWWISSLEEFRNDYPEWQPAYDLSATLNEIYEQNVDRWAAGVQA